VIAATRVVNEVDIHQSTFHNNRHSPNEIQPALYPTHQIRPPRDQKMTTAYLPFIQNFLKCIGRVLSKYNIRTVSLPTRKILSPSIYSIPCVCHKVYIGQTGSSIKERKELTTTVREVSRSEHNNDLSYRILFSNTGILAGKKLVHGNAHKGTSRDRSEPKHKLRGCFFHYTHL
jgi:hypothetical protein